MKRALVALFFSSLLVGNVGCGGSQDSSSSSSNSKAAQDADDEEKEEEVDPKGKRWGGWRWKGKRNDCFFVYDNQCFAKLAKACKKAKCGKAECGHDDSAPAKVECKK